MAERSVVIRIKGDISDYQAKLRQAAVSGKNEFDKFNKNVRDARAADQKQLAELQAKDPGRYAQEMAQRQRQAFDDLGRTAGRVGLVAAAGLGVATKAAIDWETAWAGVTKTVDGTASEMGELEESLRDLARELPATHAEIAGVAEAAGQLGIAREDIADFTETMIALGETTNLTAEEAATSIAQMANVMQTAPGDVDNLASALVALGNDGASTERDIIQMAQGISGAAAIVGLAESDVLALANATASMGIEVEAGGSAISRVLTDMGKASAQGGADLNKFAEAAGLSAEEFARSFQETPAEAFSAFITGLGEIQAAGGDVFTTLEQLGLSDVRVSRALLGMASSGDLLTRSLELGGEAWEENSALAEEFAKFLGTTASEVQISFNKIKDASIEVGNVMLPIVAQIAEGVGGLAEAFGKLPGPTEEVAASFLGITAVTGGALWFGSKVIGGIADTRRALTDLGIEAGKAGRALRGAFAATAVLAGVNALDEALEGLFDTKLEGSNLGRSLDALSRGEVTGELKKVFGDDLKGFQRDLQDTTWAVEDTADAFTSVGRVLDKIPFDGGFFSGGVDESRENIRDLDQELAQLVETGRKVDAEAIFELFTEKAGEAGISASKLKKIFSEYQVALGNVADESDDAAGSTSGWVHALESVKGEVLELGDEVEDVVDEFETLNGILSQQSAFADYRQAVRDLKEGFKEIEGGPSLNLNTDAGNETLGLIEGMVTEATRYAETLEGVAKKDFLLRVRDDLEATLEAEGLLTEGMQELLDELTALGKKDVEAKVGAKGADKVKDDLTDILGTLGRLDGKTATTYVNNITRMLTERLPEGRTLASYDGGGYTGPGGMFEPAGIVHKGEVVWSQADVARAGGVADVERMRLRGYANGGPVGFSSRPSGGGSIDLRQLAAEMAPHFANLRPLYGDVYQQPHNYNEFRREMQQDKALASSDGVRQP